MEAIGGFAVFIMVLAVFAVIFIANRFASFLSRKPGSSNDSENFTPCFSQA